MEVIWSRLIEIGYHGYINKINWIDEIISKYFKSFFIYPLVAFAHCAELIERNFIIFESKLCWNTLNVKNVFQRSAMFDINACR